MENASDGLKIGFAVLVFVMALSITMMSFSQARATSDIVMTALDRTKFYPQFRIDSVDNTGSRTIMTFQDTLGNVIEVDSNGNRVVGAETIITTLYRYHRESFVAIIKNKTGNVVGRFDLNTEQNAPWRMNRESYDKRIDYFLSLIATDETLINSISVKFGEQSGQMNGDGSYNISEKPFGTLGVDPKFVEEFVEVRNSGIYMTEEDGTEVILSSGGTTVYITYTQI
jgi:hypothetical protein